MTKIKELKQEITNLINLDIEIKSAFYDRESDNLWRLGFLMGAESLGNKISIFLEKLDND